MIQHRFFNQSDFKQNPMRAVSKRVFWRLHWCIHPDKPVLVRRWWRGMEIFLPHSAAAAPVYYRQFSSTATLQTLMEIVKPGMMVVDIGAHAGEYTLILSELCGKSGFVHAFEPQPELAEVIRRNVMHNGRSNVQVHQCAIASRTGRFAFMSDAKSGGGWIAAELGSGCRSVPATSLDDFLADFNIPRLDFIKLDAAGCEFEALQGATRCLDQMAPTVLCQIYNPDVISARCGEREERILEPFQRRGYQLSLFNEEISKERKPISGYKDALAAFQARQSYSLSLVALPPGTK
jgi:FkbM family methyltransferase